MHWNRLPGKVVEPSFLQMFKKHKEVALRHLVSGHGGD